MKLVNEKSKIEIQVKNAERPKFGGRGRTWDYMTININGKETKMHYDSTWGHNFYFKINGKWYSIPTIDNYEIIRWNNYYKLVRGNVND